MKLKTRVFKELVRRMQEDIDNLHRSNLSQGVELHSKIVELKQKLKKEN